MDKFKANSFINQYVIHNSSSVIVNQAVGAVMDLIEYRVDSDGYRPENFFISIDPLPLRDRLIFWLVRWQKPVRKGTRVIWRYRIPFILHGIRTLSLISKTDGTTFVNLNEEITGIGVYLLKGRSRRAALRMEDFLLDIKSILESLKAPD